MEDKRKKVGATLAAAGAEDRAIEKFVQEIKANWEKGSRAIMAIAKACSRADFELTTDGKERAFEELKQTMDGSRFSKYATIGSCEVLQFPHVFAALPMDSFSTLYEIATLSPDQIQEWVKQGVINPNVTREEILRRKSQRSAQAKTEPAKRDYATVTVPSDFTAESGEKLTKGLIDLAKECSAYVELEEEKLSKSGEEYWDKVQRHVRRAAHRLVKEAIEEDGRHNAKYKKARLDQLRISSDLPLPNVQANLALLNIKTSKEDLLRDAYVSVPVPPVIEGVALDAMLTFTSGEDTDGLFLTPQRPQRDVKPSDFDSFK